MVEGDQVQGGQQGGGRTYSEEDVMSLMNEAARRAAAEAVKNMPRNDEEEDMGSVINPKVVKQLKDTVAVFTALKDLSSNPLQRTIEETVGGMAASVVQSAFSPRGPPPKKDIVDTILNSQFAFGLGSGLGQRGPELVETMGRTFGQDKAGQMIENVIGRYGSGGGGGNSQRGQSRQLAGPPGPSGPSAQSEQKSDKQSEKELLLSLDPNNPEHVSAYAETQGGLPVEVARKMLMIHQDAFIEQLRREGMNVDQISTQRGSRIDTGPHKQSAPPVQHGSQAQPSRASSSVEPNSPIQQDVPSDIYEEQVPSNPGDMQYTDYQDLSHVERGQGLGTQPAPSNGKGDQQMDMMKTFATDIGKVMGEMLNKIESINNTVFTLQTEVNTIKKQGVSSTPIRPIQTSPSIHEQMSIDEPSLELFDESYVDNSIVEQSPAINQKIRRPKSSGEFFEEDIKSTTEFLKELDEDAKHDIEKLKQKTSTPYTPVPSGQVPPKEVPVAQIAPPATNSISPTIEPQKGEQEKLENKNINLDNEYIDNKNSYKLVTPIHKKSNIKPSFKKNEGKEDRETNPNKEV